MTEEETPKEDKPVATTIDDANLAAKRLEDANAEKKTLLDREEKLMAENKLSGKSDAGAVAPVVEETPEDYAKRVIAGELND